VDSCDKGSTGSTSTSGSTGTTASTGASTSTGSPASGAGGATGTAGPSTTGSGGATTGSGSGGAKDAGAGGSGGSPPLSDAGHPFPERSVVYLPTYRGGFNSWANTLPWAKMTHLNLAFADPNGSTFVFAGNNDVSMAPLVAAAHTNGVRVLIAIGGAGAGSTKIAGLYAPASVDGFVANLVSYLDALNLDGVDVDVEGAPVNANYGPFITKLVASLRPKGKLVTAALGQWFGNNVPAAAYAAFDFVNVMSYDHCTDTSPPCEHSSMAWVTSDLAFFRGKGVPADKLVLGVPFYGWCWGTGCPAATVTYADILVRWPGVPDYYVAGGLTLSYNTMATILAKVPIAKSNGGIMVWEIGQDASGTQSLMKAIGDNL